MAVNNMSIEQAYALLAELHEQATGQKSIAAINNLSDFISVAQTTLAAGYEPVLNALSQVIGRTLVAVRPYSRKFAGLEMSNEKWGGITRKISFIDTDPVTNPSFTLTDGVSVDPYVVRKPKVLETRFVGSVIYQDQVTIFKNQLDLAFTGPEELARFVSGLTLAISNKREQWLEELSRSALCNFIAAKAIVDSGSAHIHLLSEYNTVTGASPAFTSTTIRQPANWGPFVRWAYGRISELSNKMTERSVLFQAPITGAVIARHTPVEDQKIYVLDEILGSMKAEVLSTTYNPGFLSLADVEGVGYWQDIENPDEIQVTPEYMDTSGMAVTGTAQTLTDIIGVMFDRDAIGYNIFQDTLDVTPYNPKGQFWNEFLNVRVMYTNDLTEKGVVLCLD